MSRRLRLRQPRLSGHSELRRRIAARIRVSYSLTEPLGNFLSSLTPQSSSSLWFNSMFTPTILVNCALLGSAQSTPRRTLRYFASTPRSSTTRRSLTGATQHYLSEQCLLHRAAARAGAPMAGLRHLRSSLRPRPRRECSKAPTLSALSGKGLLRELPRRARLCSPTCARASPPTPLAMSSPSSRAISLASSHRPGRRSPLVSRAALMGDPRHHLPPSPPSFSVAASGTTLLSPSCHTLSLV
jgi:hypothetical protein